MWLKHPQTGFRFELSSTKGFLFKDLAVKGLGLDDEGLKTYGV